MIPKIDSLILVGEVEERSCAGELRRGKPMQFCALEETGEELYG